MEKKSKNRGTPKALKPGASFEKELGPLVKAIDKAVAGIGDEKERTQVREAVGDAVHGALRQLAARNRSASLAPHAVGDALNAGVGALKQVQELGFVEFTAGLINGTFDAIIGATIKQMDAYAALVADLAKTLTEFKAENVDEGKITAHLAGRYPDGAGGTSVRSDYEFEDTLADAANGIEEKTGDAKPRRGGQRPRLGDEEQQPPLRVHGHGQPDLLHGRAGRGGARGHRREPGHQHDRAPARHGARGHGPHRHHQRRAAVQAHLQGARPRRSTSVAKSKLHQSSLGVNVKGRFGGKSWGVSAGADYNQLRVLHRERVLVRLRDDERRDHRQVEDQLQDRDLPADRDGRPDRR